MLTKVNGYLEGEPCLQKNPAAHFILAAEGITAIAVVSQANVAGQGMQSVSEVFYVKSRYVPMGHGIIL